MRVIAAALLLLLTSGCFHVRVSSPSSTKGPAKEKETNYHILNGLTSSDVNAAECQDGMANITYYHPWWSVLCLAPITLGIVSATRVTYTCAEGRASAPAPMPPSTASAPASSRPSSFDEKATKLRDVLPVPAGVTFADGWNRVQGMLAPSFKLEKSEGILKTDWSDAFTAPELKGRYRVRVRLEASPDRTKVAVMCQAQWRDASGEWVNGGDVDVQNTLVQRVEAALSGK